MARNGIMFASVILATVLVATVAAGCIQESRSPFREISSIPKFIFDHIPEDGVSIFYIHGLDDTRYANVTVGINNMTYTELDVYSVHLKIHDLREMDVFLEAYSGTRRYILDLNITIADALEPGVLQFHIVDRTPSRRVRTYDLADSTLPWKYTLLLDRDWVAVEDQTRGAG